MPDEMQCQHPGAANCPDRLATLRDTVRLQSEAILRLHADLSRLEKRIELLESGVNHGQ
jgi:hypothetical protein